MARRRPKPSVPATTADSLILPLELMPGTCRDEDREPVRLARSEWLVEHGVPPEQWSDVIKRSQEAHGVASLIRVRRGNHGPE